VKFNIYLVRPDGFLFTNCFQEISAAVLYGLRGLGYEAEITENQVFHGETNIIFGAHMLPHGFDLPEGSIIYNWEQIGHYDAPAEYYELAKKYTLWDSSLRNVAKWSCLGHKAKHVPLVYVPELTRITRAINQDIPVLFYGSMNDRRMKILNDLLDKGIKYEWQYPVFGMKRDALIARAKIVLNVHFYGGALEMSRCGYLLSNRKAVVSEMVDDRMGLDNAMVWSSYEKIVDVCEWLSGDNREREELADRGFKEFSKILEKDILEEALDV
jgi:hypothetical protein